MRLIFITLILATAGYLLLITGIIGPGATAPEQAFTADETVSPPPPAPEPGDIARLELITGGIIEGTIIEIDDQEVTIDTEFGPLVYGPSQLSTNSRQLVFNELPEVKPAQMPDVIYDAKIIQHLLSGEETPESLGFGRNVQYIIMGNKAIFIYGQQD